jgi:hypothetical protein
MTNFERHTGAASQFGRRLPILPSNGCTELEIQTAQLNQAGIICVGPAGRRASSGFEQISSKRFTLAERSSAVVHREVSNSKPVFRSITG